MQASECVAGSDPPQGHDARPPVNVLAAFFVRAVGGAGATTRCRWRRTSVACTMPAHRSEATPRRWAPPPCAWKWSNKESPHRAHTLHAHPMSLPRQLQIQRQPQALPGRVLGAWADTPTGAAAFAASSTPHICRLAQKGMGAKGLSPRREKGERQAAHAHAR